MVLLVAAVPVLILALPDQIVRSRHLAVRAFGHELAGALPPGARIAVIDQRGFGFFEAMLRYELWRPGLPDHDLRITARLVNFEGTAAAERLRPILDDPDIRFAVFEYPGAEALTEFGVPPAETRYLVLERAGDEWRPFGIAP